MSLTAYTSCLLYPLTQSTAERGCRPCYYLPSLPTFFLGIQISRYVQIPIIFGIGVFMGLAPMT